ncbi:2-dehydropantoate 2-reductase [Vibrio europaeus]|uniref:2-dehydropantoate 2-reductase n=1 Tax=Vibrio europaeus TaxID=300876 RepID=A0ABT5GUT9_9VIBR|nr:2-dehydropantoate 2-reductase [Vibrio europaeus]MDC5704389.1 2-dehydropantoate 2-reductase [Vibrio europaeus]MDC5709019.1 2-dehydropantoate 2-reductase [Vibrio europaeus]MDC5717641.1 2-dehydropantoate 2-reductase [Vibrio europaeus]MDC5718710.1 2-dehydropantoate 2-reductase [Vibrio europaeus]MDC5727858.1 2-dehydropantoate 2-reductase [Vibrio europaeus]
MNILILGPGAIGSLWASKFQAAGHNVSLWSTSIEPRLMLQLEQQPPQTFSNRDSNSVKQADLILVTVKAWQVDAALTPLMPHVSPDAILMLMHNGMGTAESVVQKMPNNPLLLATTTHGAYKPSKQQVLHTGLGQTQLGGFNSLGNKCSFLEEVFTQALPVATWNNNIHHALWTKLAINCAINPLTAIYQVKNGQLAAQEHQLEVNELLNEIQPVLAAEQIPLSREQLSQTVNQVITATAANHSSMQQDIFHRRPSEIDFITGYLLERAQHHGISTPKNHKLYQAIKNIEQSWNS